MGTGSSSNRILRFALSLNKPLQKPMNLSSDSDSGFGLDSLRMELISHNFIYLKLHVWSMLVFWVAPVTTETRSTSPGDESSYPRGVAKKGSDPIIPVPHT